MDRFGAPAAVASIIILMLWMFASDDTKDQFMRALLFGEHGWALPIFGVLVLLDILFGFRLRRRFIDGENGELKRLALEKRRLQDLLLERKLPRTRDVGGLQVEAEDEDEVST